MTNHDKNTDMTTLWNALLEAETLEEIAAPPRLSEARVLAAIRGEKPFNDIEQLALRFSLLDRQQYTQLLQLERAKTAQMWDAENLVPQSVSLRAAADGQVRPITLPPTDTWSARLIPIGLEGKSWKIVVTIDPHLIAMTPTGFQLLDSEDVIWVEGWPDEQGQLSGFWKGADALWQRAERVTVSLMPRDTF